MSTQAEDRHVMQTDNHSRDSSVCALAIDRAATPHPHGRTPMKRSHSYRPTRLPSRLLLVGLLAVAACNDGITTRVVDQTTQVGEAEYVVDPSQNLIANQVFAPDNPGGTNGLLDSLPQPIRNQTQTVLAFAPFNGTFPVRSGG